MKPLVEGLVLKFLPLLYMIDDPEAPRGGAGIEIGRFYVPQACFQKPLVEGLVLKYGTPRMLKGGGGSPSWRGWY